MASHDTPTRSRDDHSMELPTLPSMYPHDSEGDSMLSELSRSLHQQPNLSISQILSSTPGTFPGSTVASPAPAAPATPAGPSPPTGARSTTPQPDTPASNDSFHSSSQSLGSNSTPLSSTPHASFGASRSRLSVLRSGGSGVYSTPRTDPDSTTSSRTRFALSGPWNESRDEDERGESFGTPAIQRFSGGPDSFDFEPERREEELEAEQPSDVFHQPPVADEPTNESFGNTSGASGGFQDVDLSEQPHDDLGQSDLGDESRPYIDMPSLEESFEVPVNFGTPSAAGSRSRLTSQDLSLVEEEDEEDAVLEEDGSPESDKENTGDSKALQEMSSPEMKSTFITLGRRRSNSRNRRSVFTALDHSPASTSSLSETSAGTPNGASQASPRRDSFQVQDQSIGSDDEPAPNEVANVTIDTLDTPHARTFRDFSVPLPESNYGTPSPTSSASAAKGSLSTPKPSSALELRKSVALAALASSSRPKMRGTPHTRRSSSFAGTNHSSVDFSPRHQSPSAFSHASQSHNESLISLSQLTVDESNTSVLSVDSAEDLTNLHRANTSLPLSEATPKQGGIKIHKHLHNLNTQLHLRNTTLQDERDQLEAENEELKRRLEAAEGGADASYKKVHGDEEDPRLHQLQTALEESEEELYALRQTMEEEEARRADQDEEIRRLEGLDEELNVLREQVDMISQQHGSTVLTSADDRSHVEGTQEEVASVKAQLEERERLVSDLEGSVAAAKADLARQGQVHSQKLAQLEADVEEILKTSQADLDDALEQKEELHAQASVDKAALDNKSLELEAALNNLQQATTSLDSVTVRVALLEEELHAAVQTIEQKDELISRLSQPSPDSEADERFKALEVELSSVKLAAELKERELQHHLADLTQQFESTTSELDAVRSTLAQTQSDVERARQECQSQVELAERQEKALSTAEAELASQQEMVEQIQAREASLAEEAADLQSQLLDLTDKLSSAVRLQESHSSKQSLLEAAHSQALEKAQAAYEESLQALDGQLHEVKMQSAQDREQLISARSQLEQANLNLTPRPRSRTPLAFDTPAGPSDSIVEDLRQQLHDAHVEIGRLQADIASSPYRRTAIEARDLRIQVLESQKSNIDSQFSVLRRQSRKLSLNSANNSFNTTVPNQTIMSVRTPQSAGPLKSMPWLDQTPGPQPDAALLAEVARLRQQLDDLNELVDDGVDKLRNAGSDQTALAQQLSEAREEISSLQTQLSQLRQREMTTPLDHGRLERAKKALEADVQDLTQDLDATRRDLSSKKRENASLQDDVRAVTRDFEACKRDLQDAEEHVERLQDLLDRARNHADEGSRVEVDELKRARSQLEKKMLRAEQELSEVSKRASQLVSELESTRTTNSALRSEMAAQAAQVDRLRHVQADSARDTVGREGTLREIADLQQDLLRTRRDVKSLEEEIKSSRKREEAAERREARRGDDENQATSKELQTALANIDMLKARHRKETQGIFVEVKHLKAVILRESTFRSDLSLQKEYLLILIGQLSRQQARVYAAIAQLGYPHPSTGPKRRSFKSVALAVLMTIRVKNAAGRWSRELETRQALKEAHERVRASRLLQPVADTQKLSSSNAHRQSSTHSGKRDHDAPRRRTSSTNNLPR